jgi:hypothetical protein
LTLFDNPQCQRGVITPNEAAPIGCITDLTNILINGGRAGIDSNAAYKALDIPRILARLSGGERTFIR